MDIGSLLLVLAVTLIVAGFVARPLMDRAVRPDSTAGTSDLTTQREAVLTELRELDFDHDTGKMIEEDYQVQRNRLVETGARILRALDQLQPAPADEDNIERLVAARRRRSTADDAAVERKVAARRQSPVVTDDEIEQAVAARRSKAGAAAGPACPKCRNAVLSSDKFCPHCGAKLI
jgi:hypothetical protein